MIAVVLESHGKKVALFQTRTIGRGSSLVPDLSPLESAFLQEVKSFGEFLYIPVAEANDLPVLASKSILKLREMLSNPISVQPTSSRILAQGSGKIYLISPAGEVSIVDQSGHVQPIF